ncbi:RCC1 repeat-containing protein [Limnochorda pilosa]|uniref:RCC1 repeat-containing protein n=1 Tax=Limnochorda pilosa TaxID=1555112 RepID=A0A0K2SJC7_LIMPI|nr:RCC1 repeat-containing protein [Limnochorda pilosa]
MLDGGNDHSLALRDGQGAWAWGSNSNGQLGDGTTTYHRTPVQVSGLSGLVAVAGGQSYSLALKSDGTAWAWGGNFLGQLGDGTTADRRTPVQVGSLSGIVAVAAGVFHSLALKSDGTVWAWGYNFYGQLGDGTQTDHSTPVQVKGPGGTGVLIDIIAIAAGGFHSLALRSDGTVWAWGDNSSGQLGDGTTTNSWVPVQVKGAGGTGFLTNAAELAGGTSHSLALKSDGTVWAWGSNGAGQLGDGTTTTSGVPVQVKGPGGTGLFTSVAAVASGSFHNLALRNDGSVWAWGSNVYGQLGDGSTANRSTPVQVSGLTDPVAIAGGTRHSLALKSDGTLWAWGSNDSGQLGDGTLIDRPVPSQVNFRPSANAGADRPVPLGAPVTLDGSGSSDPEGDPLTYAWSFTSQPAGSTATLAGASTATPSFTPDLAGDYVVQLVVNDGTSDSAPDTVTLTAVRSEEVAHGPSPASSTVTFHFGPDVGGTLYVYAASGRLAWHQEVPSGTRDLAWNLTGDDGRPLANGVYLYLVVRSDGSRSPVGKLLVIR